MLSKLTQAGRYVSQSLRLMGGVPEYNAYVAHMANAHPDRTVMSYEEFFRERQEARYGGNGKISRCC
jgi:uncharacterized short protein YbdD (DUF466 family)